MGHGLAADAGGIAFVYKGAVAVIPVEGIHLARKIGNHQIREAIVVVVREIDSHSCKRMALGIDGHTRYERHLLKRTITLVVIKEFGHGIAGNKEIDVPVAVVIRNSYAPGLCPALPGRPFSKLR